jgi:hypothetical protein
MIDPNTAQAGRFGNQDNAIWEAIASAVAVVLLGWMITRVQAGLDRQRVHRWLRANTRDEPGESHVTTEAIAKGTGLPDSRVRRACVSDVRVFRPQSQPEQWSVWRMEPQSIYEKRGPLVF